ncbi:hypothetical protein DIE00_04835 [Burkholderia sp. Bp8989]|nr:hypothetical protein DIE00_04835 [Burkholderia sp. Bp8989]
MRINAGGGQRFTASPLHRFTASPLHRFTASPLHRFTASPLHAARCTLHAAHGTRHTAHGVSIAPAWVAPRSSSRLVLKRGRRLADALQHRRSLCAQTPPSPRPRAFGYRRGRRQHIAPISFSNEGAETPVVTTIHPLIIHRSNLAAIRCSQPASPFVYAHKPIARMVNA